MIRREVLNDGRCWLEIDVEVVRDDAEVLGTSIPVGAELRYPLGDLHPWWPKRAWERSGVLTLQRPGDWYGVWLFDGADGAYVNFQAPFTRGDGWYATQDLELDIVVRGDGSWEWKDEGLLEQRAAEGRFTAEQVEAVRRAAAEVVADLDARRYWWR